MSTAHRPTWDPAQAKDVKGGSRQFSVRDMAAHTKLKFRYVLCVRCLCGSLWDTCLTARGALYHRQPGQTSAAEVSKRDLRAELLAAEAEAREKKRKADGRPTLAVEGGAAADDEANKRRKLLQEALDMDKDDDDEEEEKGPEKEEKEGGEDEDDSCVQPSILTATA